jgi:hypothetical protein
MTKKKPLDHIDHDYSNYSDCPPFLRTPAWRERMLADERERERERGQLERQRTVAGSGKIAEQGNALRKIILDALAEATRHIHPAYPEKRPQIITRVLDETNAQLSARVKSLGYEKVKKELGRVKVGRSCVRKHLVTYWNENPSSAPVK